LISSQSQSNCMADWPDGPGELCGSMFPELGFASARSGSEKWKVEEFKNWLILCSSESEEP
jgi:hypothetical protein